MSQLPVGTQAPDFTMTGLDGRSHRLADALKSGPVVLAFYKVGCPTSQFTFPFIQQIVSEAGKEKSWTIWGISQDDAQETRSFAERFGKLRVSWASSWEMPQIVQDFSFPASLTIC